MKLLRLPLLLFFLLALAQTASGQLVSQGNEQTIKYSGATAFILTNTPLNPNLLTGTGQNTFLMNINPPSNSLRIYITNDTANACTNLTVSVASTGNPNLTSFNQNVNAWSSVQVQSGTGGLVTSQPITLPANGTVTVTTVPIVASKVAVFIVLSSGCATTNVDVQTSFGTFSPAVAAVQGLVTPGGSAASVDPVIIGGLSGSTNLAQSYGACSQLAASGCGIGNGQAIPVGANGNTTTSAFSGTNAVVTLNAGGAPLAVSIGGTQETAANSQASFVISGGTVGASSQNPPGLFVSNTGYSHFTTQTVTVTASATLFAPGGTGFGGVVFDSCYVQINAVNTAGTTPTLDVFFQTSEDGASWNDRIHFTQATTGTLAQYAGISGTSTGITPVAVGNGVLAAATKVDGPIGSFGRMSFVTTGTGPSYTLTWGVDCH